LVLRMRVRFLPPELPPSACLAASDSEDEPGAATLWPLMGSLIKKRRKRMRKKKHKKMLKATRWQRRAGK
jgi:hypothetical protein